MRDRDIPVSREALYEEVWSDPVTVVARRYGLSDVGLVKICKKLRIRVPGRGYWAKVKAGRPTRKVPLPALAAGTPAPSGPTPHSEHEAALRARVPDTLLKTRQSQPTISVPSELVDPHPLVRAAAARLRQRDGWDHPAGVRSAPKEVLDMRARNDEHGKLRALFRDASRLQRANRLREFITAVEDRAHHDGELTPEKQQWIEWAKAKADWIDPLVRRSDPILDTPEPQRPSYWSWPTAHSST